MCIPPSDPSYAEVLTFCGTMVEQSQRFFAIAYDRRAALLTQGLSLPCGTMVETIYPTGLSPPSDLLSFIIDPMDLHVLSYPDVAY